MRVILYTGKGGVGKTTTAAATALRLADAGTRVLVLSTDGAHSLGDSLGVRLSGEPTAVAERLDALEVNPTTEGERAWSAIQHQLGRMLGPTASVAADEMVLFPGLSELFSLLRVLDAAESGRYDVIVVDCAPTGETLSLLRYPEQFAAFVTFALPTKRKIVRAVGPAVEKLTSFPVPKEDVFDEVEVLTDRLNTLRELLTDPATSTLRIVTTPERVPVAEARRNHTWLHLYGFSVDAVVVNRVLPAAALDGYFSEYRARQDECLTLVREGFAGLVVFTLELRPAEVVGMAALREVGALLFADADPAAVLVHEPPYEVTPVDGGYRLSLRLPDATRDELSLDQSGTDLVITARGQRRVLALPDVLVGAQLTGARLEAGTLVVSFAARAATA